MHHKEKLKMNKLFKKIAASVLVVSAFSLALAVPATANAATQANCNDNDLSITNGVNCAQPTGTPTKLVGAGGIFNTVANILIFLVGVVAVIMLIIGGIRYAVSGGDQAAVTSAKNTILYAIIGLVVAFMAFAIINFITSRLQDSANAGVIVTQNRGW